VLTLQRSFVVYLFPLPSSTFGGSGVSGRGVSGDIEVRKDSALGAGVAGYEEEMCGGTAGARDSGGCIETSGSSTGSIILLSTGTLDSL